MYLFRDQWDRWTSTNQIAPLRFFWLAGSQPYPPGHCVPTLGILNVW